MSLPPRAVEDVGVGVTVQSVVIPGADHILDSAQRVETGTGILGSVVRLRLMLAATALPAKVAVSMPAPAVEDVVVSTSIKQVVAIATVEGVGARPAIQRVVAVAAIERIGSRIAVVRDRLRPGR